MLSNNEMLKRLTPFKNNVETIKNEQGTGDIIAAILDKQKECAADYDQLVDFFLDVDPIETAKNVFSYLKNNVDYKIESESRQLIKTPAAIIATGRTLGSDCKNYSLFINGTMAAVQRATGWKYDLYFRFANYTGGKTPEHVFAVMIYKGKEYWIDPVLTFFNQQKEPDFYIDKKINNNMALMALSGVRNRIGDDGTDFSSDGSGDTSSFDTTVDTGGGTTDNSNTGYDTGSTDASGILTDANGDEYIQNADGSVSYDNGNGTYTEYGTGGDVTVYTNDGIVVQPGDTVNSDGSVDHDNGDGTYTETEKDGTTTKYDNSGNTISAPSKSPINNNIAPSRAGASAPSGGGGGTSSGGGGSAQQKQQTPTNPSLTDILKSLVGILKPSTTTPKKVTPITNKPATTTSTSTYLMYGAIAAVAIYFATKKKK